MVAVVMATMGAMPLVPVVALVAVAPMPVGLRAGDHDAEREHRGKGDRDPTQCFSPPTSHSLANRPTPTVAWDSLTARSVGRCFAPAFRISARLASADRHERRLGGGHIEDGG
jgi:hypothetical protein